MWVEVGLQVKVKLPKERKLRAFSFCVRKKAQPAISCEVPPGSRPCSVSVEQ